MGLTPRIRLRHVQGEYVVSSSDEPLRLGEKPLAFSDSAAAAQFIGGLLLDGDAGPELGRLYHQLDVGPPLPPTRAQVAEAIACQLAAGRIRIAPVTKEVPPDPAPVDLDVAALMKLIGFHEGRRNVAYEDTAEPKHPTIGVGFNLDRPDAKARIENMGLDYNAVREKRQRLSDAQIDVLFEESLSEAIEIVKSLVPRFDSLSRGRKEALIDMAFNLGKPKLAGFKDMLAAVNRQDWKRAAKEMLNSKWAKQVQADRIRNNVTRMLGIEARLIEEGPPPVWTLGEHSAPNAGRRVV